MDTAKYLHDRNLCIRIIAINFKIYALTITFFIAILLSLNLNQSSSKFRIFHGFPAKG